MLKALIIVALSAACAVLYMGSGNWFMATSLACTAVGVLMNAIAIQLNGGKMPVTSERWSGNHRSHQAMTSSTRLRWLCDIIPTRIGTASVGDVFLLLGVVLSTANLIWLLAKLWWS